MWKKTDEPQQQNPSPMPPSAPQRPEPTRRELATIGPSITVKGDLSGEEDLIIQGRLEGEIVLRKNNVNVGKTGRVKADIYGKSIQVDGEVKGNLYGDQEVIIRASGRVQGNIVSPRVTLENGSKFKGSIDMEPATRTEEAPEKPAIESKRPAPRPPSPAKTESQLGLKPSTG